MKTEVNPKNNLYIELLRRSTTGFCGDYVGVFVTLEVPFAENAQVHFKKNGDSFNFTSLSYWLDGEEVNIDNHPSIVDNIIREGELAYAIDVVNEWFSFIGRRELQKES
ncbi:hypothetical protein [Alteromonas gracilis]|uniref:hypothetical protein n=1 Tax=Alteromonas gracilis TaxID=1479524 RepID=UPI003737046D